MKTLFHIVKLYIFWVLLFLFYRFLFVGFNFKLFHDSSTIAIAQIFLNALRLDLSMASYLVIIPAVVFMIWNLFQNKYLQLLHNNYHYVVIVLITLIELGNIIIYKYWNNLISKRALQFLNDPKEMFASVTTFETIVIFLIIATLIVGGRLLFKVLQCALPIVIDTKLIAKLIAIPIIALLITFNLRGGFQLIPINESAAYFSNKAYENHAAINPVWFLGRNLLLSNKDQQKEFTYMEKEKADSLFSQLMNAESDSFPEVLNNEKPNIVILMCESHTTDVISSLGGDTGNSPNLDSLVNESLSFENCYASGFRTDQGLAAIFSGFPAQPNNSIIRHDDKLDKLPYITKPFLENGYNTSFFYGGEIDFSNMKSYLVHAGIKTLSDKNDYDSKTFNSKWGAQDEFVLNHQIEKLNTTPQPFFSSLLTLSLHEPFEIPIAHKYAGSSESIKFKNAAYYTDKCLGDYFRKAKLQPWYANTLFIIVADHGHHLPRERDYYDPLQHRIPLLFLGGALKEEYRGKKILKTTAQHDIAGLLLSQLNYKTSEFTFSKNTLNAAVNSSAYICFDDGFTFITDSCAVNYSNTENKMKTVSSTCKANSNELLETGRAYMQKVYELFMGL